MCVFIACFLHHEFQYVHFGLLLRMVTQLSIFRRSAGVKVGSIDAAALSVAA